MPPPRSSRRRFLDYRSKLKQRRREKASDAANKSADKSADQSAPIGYDPHGDPKKNKPRTRSFGKLLAEFWGLLKDYRGMLAFALLALGISTLLGLIPLYGTKVV